MTETKRDPLIYGFEFGADGHLKRLGWADVADGPAARPGVRRWLHLDRLSPAVQSWLTDRSGIDAVIDASLLQEDTRPRCLAHEDGLLINLRGVNLNEGSEPEDMIAIRIWMTAEVVVSLRAFHIKAAQDLSERIMAGDVPETSGAMVTYLAERLTDRIEPVITDLDEQGDAYEETLLSPGSTLPKTALSNFRRKVLTLRRYIIPQRDALAQMTREGRDLFSDLETLKLREVADRVTRLGEELDTIRERSVVLQEQLVEERSERMNQRLFVLSIISAVFLPLSFVTGLFGVNIAGMPGVENPMAFAVLCFGMLGLATGLIALFRGMRWL